MKTTAILAKQTFNNEKSIGKMIPYTHYIDDSTIELRNGNLIQVIRVSGLSADTLDDSVRDMEKRFRNGLLMAVGDANTAIYFHTIRKKTSVMLDAKYPDGFLSDLNGKWNEKLNNESFYINEHYITVVSKQPAGKINRFTELLRSITNQFTLDERDHYRAEALAGLYKKTNQIISGLNYYGAYRVKNTMLTNGTIRAESSELLSYLLNLEDRVIFAPENELASVLSTKRHFFDSHAGVVAIRGIDNQVKYAAVLSIENYCDKTIAGMYDYLFDIKCNLVISQSFSPLDRQLARKAMKERKRNLEQSDDGASSASEQIIDMLDTLATDKAIYGDHTFNILVHAESQKDLNDNIFSIDTRLNQLGIITRREDAGLRPAYFSMLPGNQAYITRKGIVTSLNMASLASLHNTSIGQRTDNHWGDAVTVLETISGSPYFFNFHVLDVGNTFMIGSQGSGKTLLESFLLAMSVKFGGRAVVFDKDRGMEIFIRAQSGIYNILKVGTRTGFAPFQMDDTEENRYFLHKLLRKMVEISGLTIDSGVDERLSDLVAGAFVLPKKERVLRNIVSFIGMQQVGSLRSALDNWVNDGCYAWVFDNDVDTLSLDSHAIGFDMTSVFDEEVVVGILYFYLFHRIEALIDGNPMRIVCAEGWKALRDNEFQKKIQDWSSTPRKKNALLIIDTQTPEDISSSDIGCKVIQESVTQIYFANPKASYDDYVGRFKLTQKEYEIIKNLDKRSRFFLLKHGQNSVIVRADLSQGFDDEIAILSGRTQNLKILDNLRKQHGDNPAVWLPLFKAEVREQRGKAS